MYKYLFVFFLLFSLSVKAQIGAMHSFEFLNLPASSKINALGGNAGAVNQNDLSLAFQNPALLQPAMDRQLSINHSFLFAGIQHGYVGYARHIAKNVNTTFSGGVQYINYGRFQRTDETGQTFDKFRAAEFALVAGTGKQFANNFSFGVNSKFIMSYFDDMVANAVAVDLATAYIDTAKRITVSLMIKNAGIETKSYAGRNYYEASNREPLPVDVQLAVAKRLAHIPFTLSVVAHHLQKFDIRYDNPADNVTSSLLTTDTVVATKVKHYYADKVARHFIIGGIFHLGKAVQLQMGYNHLRRMELKTSERNGLIGFSMGIGITTKGFSIGYSRAYFYLPSANNQISFSKTLAAPHKKYTSITPSF